MIGPGFSLNIVKDPRRQVWVVNADPKKLDAMYNRLLGPNGDRMLPDEIKWLAVTHRSFDYGRRGHNTKLGYYGSSGRLGQLLIDDCGLLTDVGNARLQGVYFWPTR